MNHANFEAIKAAHVCNDRCAKNSKEHRNENNILTRSLYHVEPAHDLRFWTDEFVGPRAWYTFHDGQGEVEVPFAAPTDFAHMDGPFGDRPFA